MSYHLFDKRCLAHTSWRDEDSVYTILEVKFKTLGLLYSVGEVFASYRCAINKRFSHVVPLFVDAKLRKKIMVHKFVDHKLVYH